MAKPQDSKAASLTRQREAMAGAFSRQAEMASDPLEKVYKSTIAMKLRTMPSSLPTFPTWEDLALAVERAFRLVQKVRAANPNASREETLKKLFP